MYIASLLGAFCSEAASLPETHRWTNKKKNKLGDVDCVVEYAVLVLVHRCACVKSRDDASWVCLWSHFCVSVKGERGEMVWVIE